MSLSEKTSSFASSPLMKRPRFSIAQDPSTSSGGLNQQLDASLSQTICSLQMIRSMRLRSRMHYDNYRTARLLVERQLEGERICLSEYCRISRSDSAMEEEIQYLEASDADFFQRLPWAAQRLRCEEGVVRGERWRHAATQTAELARRTQAIGHGPINNVGEQRCARSTRCG